MARRRSRRGRTRTRTIYKTRTRRVFARARRGARRGIMGAKEMLRRGKIHDVGAGVGGGVLVGAALSRVSPNPTVSTVGGLAGSWLFGGLWGLLGYAGLRFFTSGLQFGNTNISANTLSAQARPALAAGAGVQAI